MDGRKVCAFSKKLDALNTDAQQDVRRLPPGVYFTRIKDNNSILEGRFIKK
jgi:hypothetical protein